MKGTLFSADFCYDGSGDPRLLEINTDTSFLKSVVDDKVNFSDFVNVLQANSITSIHVIYKNFQTYFVQKLEDYILANASFITSFEKTEEEPNAIYPTTVADADDKFILRLVYDESALFDSNYAKSETNLFKLFHNSSDSNSVVPVFYSGSGVVLDSLTESFNNSNIPDYVSKLAQAGGVPGAIKFYKLGVPETGSDYRVNTFKSDVADEDTFITNYLSTVTDNRSTSVRSFQIVYGSNLDLVYLAQYEVDSFLTIPSDAIVTGSNVTNEISNKQFFEFATNDPKEEHGVLHSSFIISQSGEGVTLENAQTGSIFKSYFISGSPDTDSYVTLGAWSHSGSTLPSGSFITSSAMISKAGYTSVGWALRKLSLDGYNDVIYIGGSSKVPTYQSSSDSITWKSVRHIEVGDKIYNMQGDPVTIVSHSVVIFDNKLSASTIEPDLEQVDTYITSGSTEASSIIIHNAPCFVAGTEIELDGDVKNIEDVIEGDIVLTFNFETSTIEPKEVLKITSREVGQTVVYTLDNTSTLEATLDHPLYVEEKGWSSQDPELSNSMYNIGSDINKIVEGDIVKLSNGNSKITLIEVKDTPTTVYNLAEVADNHNFFANKVLAHNRAVFVCFTSDTKVNMFDGTIKNIKDITVGDIVTTMTGEKGIVKDAITHPINDIVPVYYNGNVKAEGNHPILVDGQWTTPKEAGWSYEWRFIDNFYNLEIEGGEHTFTVEGVVVSGLGDNAELNNKYQRQPLELIKHLG